MSKYNQDLILAKLRCGPRWWAHAQLPAENIAVPLTPAAIMVESITDALHSAGVPAECNSLRRMIWRDITEALDEDNIAEYGLSHETFRRRGGGLERIHIDLPTAPPPKATEYVEMRFESDVVVIMHSEHQEQPRDRMHSEGEGTDTTRHAYADQDFFEQVQARLAEHGVTLNLGANP